MRRCCLCSKETSGHKGVGYLLVVPPGKMKGRRIHLGCAAAIVEQHGGRLSALVAEARRRGTTLAVLLAEMRRKPAGGPAHGGASQEAGR